MADKLRNAWLCLAVGDSRQHGSNDGYTDSPESNYCWDDTVPNCTALKAGDVLVLWDKEILLGCSVIEEIHVEPGVKTVRRCPLCGSASLKPRKTMLPRYRCFDCRSNFDDADEREISVVNYRSDHGAAWVDLSGVLQGAELRRMAKKERSQLSLRPMHWDMFRQAVADRGVGGMRIVDKFDVLISGGHSTRIGRIRIGQARFRASLLERFGSVCAVSGPAPLDVLDACHLYSFAASGEHDVHGGLMLRKDIHKLFDVGAIAVAPDAMTVDVVQHVRGFAGYQELHGRSLHVEVSWRTEKWLRDHWNTHRVRVDAEGSGTSQWVKK